MNYEKIIVISYSGYKGEERPKTFILYGDEINVIEIIDMWIKEDLRDKGRKRFFKVVGSDGYIYRIYFDENNGEWFLAKG
ncbi:MAG: hypothetical protein IBX72_04290 [Nitrospirae bacterium]|jgi:hypothetical protein|nr:hypothetical protein [Nitrospirota bacterium]